MRRRTILWAAAALLLLSSLPAVAASATYVNHEHGFSIKLPGREWSQTPTQPGEKTEVAKFKDDQKQNFSTLSILRFAVAGSTPTTPGAGAPAQPQQVPMPGRWGAPTSAREYLKRTLARTHRYFGLEFEDLPEPEMVEFEDDVEGPLWEVVVEHTRRKGYYQSILAGIASNGREEYLIVFTYPKKMKTVLRRKWVKSIRSFEFVEGEDSPTEEEIAEDLEDRDKTRRRDKIELIDVEKRERIKADLIGDWRFIDTPHYIVIYNCDDPLAKYIAKRVEYMRENAFEKVFPPVAPIEEAMVVRVCKEPAEYRHYGGPPGSAGYWASYKDELVFPDLSSGSKPDDTTIGVLHHEAFHQYVYYALLKHDPPVWFNEGYAEYFFTVESTGSKLKFMKSHPMRYGTVKTARGEGKLIPLKDFTKLTHRQYMQQATLCYAQGWAFAKWLKQITKDERWQQIPDIFFKELQDGYRARESGVVEAAYAKAFEGIDWDEMNEAFVKDLKTKLGR